MIRSKASLTVLIMAGLFRASVLLFGQALPTTVRVPEGNGRPILTDGIFSPGEWDVDLFISPDGKTIRQLHVSA